MAECVSWKDQGRQDHGHFGHGKASQTNKPSRGGSDPLFDAGNIGYRIDAIAHTALAHMPRGNRHRSGASFNPQRLERLRTVMAAWGAARSLSDGAFEERFVDASISSAVVGKLRAAAERVTTATTHKDLAAASADLAGAMQGIGLEK
jgi:hypothetical protein